MNTSGDDDPPGGSPPAGSPPPIDAPQDAPQIDAPADTSAPMAGGFAPVPPDDAILPAAVDDDALRDAVGVPAKKPKKRKPLDEVIDDAAEGDPTNPKMSRKMMAVIAASLVGGIGIAALVLLGRVNADRYQLTCTTTRAVAEQGRAFPPWGYRALTGAEWKAIALPPNAQCKTEEISDIGTLEARFLDLLLERTSAALTVRNMLDATTADGKTAAPLDVISAQLEQALLLSRAPERGDQRKQVERLLGDVGYWRASLRLRDASAALADAARQFDAAALQRPMHASDAGAWAEFLRRLTDELHAGPAGMAATATMPAAPDRPSAPPGTALPVEPDPSPAAGSAAPPSPPDAGVPTGGVLL